MDLDKIIRDNEHKAFSSKTPYEFEHAIIKEGIRQALELACDKIEKKKPLECGYIGYKMGLNDSKQSIMSIINEI